MTGHVGYSVFVDPAAALLEAQEERLALAGLVLEQLETAAFHQDQRWELILAGSEGPGLPHCCRHLG